MTAYKYIGRLSVVTIILFFIKENCGGPCPTEPTVTGPTENNVCYVEKTEVETVSGFEFCPCDDPLLNNNEPTNITTVRPSACLCYVEKNRTVVRCEPECCSGFVYNDTGNCVAVSEIPSTTTATPGPIFYQIPRFINCPSFSTELIIKVPSHLNYAIFSPELLNLTALDFTGTKMKVFYSHSSFQATFPQMNSHNVVAYTGTDSHGNKAVCNFRVTVKDEHPPQYTKCPDSFIREEEEVVTWDLPQAVDNVQILKDPTLEIGPQRGTTSLEPGIHSVFYKVSDLEGNEAVCQFTITITEKTTTIIYTTTTPIPYKSPQFINCPKNVETHEDENTPGLYRINITLTAVDYLGVELNVTFTETEFDATTEPKNYTVAASSAPDKAGEVAQCVFSASVPGKPPPVTEKQEEPIWPMIVGGILGFLLLILIILAVIYLCKHKKRTFDDSYTDLHYTNEEPPAYQLHPDDVDLSNNRGSTPSYVNPGYSLEPPPEASGVSPPENTERPESHKYMSIIDVGADYTKTKPDIDTEYDNALGVSDVDIDYNTAKFEKR